MVDLPKLQSIELGDNVFSYSIVIVQEGDGGSQEVIDSDRDGGSQEVIDSDREDSSQEDVGGNQEDIGSHQESDNSQEDTDNAQVSSQNNLHPQIILTMKSIFYCILH